MDMPMEFWVRSEECKRLKTEHLDYIDDHYAGSREAFIEDTVFTDPLSGAVRDTVLEPNMFPYQTPPGVEHWTLWSRSDMSHEEIQRWVTAWLMAHRPQVRRWNYDDNAGDRSIYWFHVHVYLEYDSPEQARPRITGEAAERDAARRSRYCAPARPPPSRRRHGHGHRSGGRRHAEHGSRRHHSARSPAPSPSPARHTHRRKYEDAPSERWSGGSSGRVSESVDREAAPAPAKATAVAAAAAAAAAGPCGGGAE